ncbi:MAG TPA: RNA methyltransferase [Thermoleophilia bacterium]|nr:RNA methyltransferase [Thermoleophilia bacterium]
MASLRQRKFREREGAFLVEGADLVLAGIASGRLPEVVFVQAERSEELVAQLLPGARRAPGAALPAVFPVTARVAQKMTTMETPPDVMAVFPRPARPDLAAMLQSGAGSLVVYADGIADPGNMGSLLRAAVAFGATALATSPGATDVFGPKAVRASMGAVFGLPLLPDQPLGELLDQLQLVRVYGLAAHEGTPIGDVELRRPAALVVGAERSGLSREASRHVTDVVTIPMTAGVAESLNAGVAGAIALYEFSRRSAGACDHESSRPAAAAKG